MEISVDIYPATKFVRRTTYLLMVLTTELVELNDIACWLVRWHSVNYVSSVVNAEPTAAVTYLLLARP